MILVDAVYWQHKILAALDAFVHVEAPDGDVEPFQIGRRSEFGWGSGTSARLLGLGKAAEGEGDDEEGELSLHHFDYREESVGVDAKFDDGVWATEQSIIPSGKSVLDLNKRSARSTQSAAGLCASNGFPRAPI